MADDKVSAPDPVPSGGFDSSDPSKTHANIIEHARNATEKEHKMTLKQGIKLYPKAIIWSLLISTCIVMEGFQMSLVNNFYAFPQFNKKYGVLTDKGTYEIPAPWQAGLSNVG
jgi:SP family general alpha glucoside:H+ symporter-like MFS transporter